MRQPDYTIPTYDESLFAWAPNNTGVADISDLGKPSALGTLIWQDASDIGFWIRGRDWKRLFTFRRTKRDIEGNILCWVYESPAGYRATIFND